jgi:D-arabinose 1-dehydrogenase-like Zn-dependent alcohol dehydrogenase
VTADTGRQARAVLAVRNEALVAIESVTLLDPGSADVVVGLTASGVCHSDLAAARGTLGPATTPSRCWGTREPG